jgi:hypothetical protein
MAQYYGVNSALNLNLLPSAKVPPGEGGGELAVFFDSFVLPNPVLNAADVVSFCASLPPQARLIDLHMVFPAWANSATVNLGWLANEIDAANPTGIASALAVTAAGQFRMSTTGSASAGMYKKFNVGSPGQLKETQLQLAVVVAPTNTTGTNYFCATVITN